MDNLNLNELIQGQYIKLEVMLNTMNLPSKEAMAFKNKIIAYKLTVYQLDNVDCLLFSDFNTLCNKLGYSLFAGLLASEIRSSHI